MLLKSLARIRKSPVLKVWGKSRPTNSDTLSAKICVSNKYRCAKQTLVKELLEFYMGKNTMERQNFIIDNLVIEEDIA